MGELCLPETESYALQAFSGGVKRDSISPLVARLLGDTQQATWPERRRETRYPFPRLIRLTPVTVSKAVRAAQFDWESLPETGEPFTAVGKKVSESGIGFYHPQPIAYRHVVATISRGSSRPVHLLVDLSWCRFTEEGWYESGGRFLSEVAP